MGLWVCGTVYKAVKLTLEHESRVNYATQRWKRSQVVAGLAGGRCVPIPAARLELNTSTLYHALSRFTMLYKVLNVQR